MLNYLFSIFKRVFASFLHNNQIIFFCILLLLQHQQFKINLSTHQQFSITSKLLLGSDPCTLCAQQWYNTKAHWGETQFVGHTSMCLSVVSLLCIVSVLIISHYFLVTQQELLIISYLCKCTSYFPEIPFPRRILMSAPKRYNSR
jgi:hypothetical protein